MPGRRFPCKLETCRTFSHGETHAVEILVENSPGERIDAFLAARLADLSRSRIQTLIREQYIQINGHPAQGISAATVVNVQLHHCQGKLSGIGGTFHRNSGLACLCAGI
jgi:23S rRNA-/tRNA-specific pseudouridylate synthase